MKELSIFVDESGDFGNYRIHSPFYIVVMVLHDQAQDVSKEIIRLEKELANLGYEEHVVHTEPLIRREEDYKNLLPNERRSIFTKLFYFTLKCNIQYKSFVFRKKEFKDVYDLENRIAREISLFIRENLTYFQKFEKVILYYDNGQHELNKILNTVLSTEFTGYEVKKVLPCNYRLFQAADMICTLELLNMKSQTGNLSRSEILIFHSLKELKKDFFKKLRKKVFFWAGTLA